MGDTALAVLVASTSIPSLAALIVAGRIRERRRLARIRQARHTALLAAMRRPYADDPWPAAAHILGGSTS